MSIDKNLLKRLTLLYVEDDDVIRNELSQLLANFFSKVLVARDGKEGFRTYLENQDHIDVILTDLNMYPHAVDQKDYEGYFSLKGARTAESYKYAADSVLINSGSATQFKVY